MNAHLDPVSSLLVLGIVLAVAAVLLLGILRRAARPTIAAPAPVDTPVQGRAVTLCVVQWCPTSDAHNQWRGWPLCDVHFADLMNAHVIAVRDVTGDVLADEAAAYLRRQGGVA